MVNYRSSLRLREYCGANNRTYLGEWIVVQFDNLTEGDEIVGNVASFVDDQAAEMLSDE